MPSIFCLGPARWSVGHHRHSPTWHVKLSTKWQDRRDRRCDAFAQRRQKVCIGPPWNHLEIGRWVWQFSNVLSLNLHKPFSVSIMPSHIRKQTVMCDSVSGHLVLRSVAPARQQYSPTKALRAVNHPHAEELSAAGSRWILQAVCLSIS